MIDFKRLLLMGVMTAAMLVASPKVQADPIITPILASVAIAATTAGASLAVTTAIVTATSIAIKIGVSIGLSYLAKTLFAPKLPRPQDRQTLSKDGTYSRFTGYGTTLTSGLLVFACTYNGALYRVVAFGEGGIDGIEEFRLGNDVVTLDVDGNVTAPARIAGAANIQFRVGTDSQLAYSDLITASPTHWNSTAQGNRIVHALIRLNAIDVENFNQVWPQGEPIPKAKIRRRKVWDPRDPAQSRHDPDTWLFSENAALCILDLVLHTKGGYKMPWRLFNGSLSETEGAIEVWKIAADICDEDVPLKGGGTVKRYIISTSHVDYSRRPAEILSAMQAACGGEFYYHKSGGLGIYVAKWIEPTVTITADSIKDSFVSRGDTVVTSATVFRAKYVSPPHNYETADAAEWVNVDAVAKRGEHIADLDFPCVPNHSQCRRLMAWQAQQGAPDISGKFVCDASAIKVIGEKFIRIVVPEDEIDCAAYIIDGPDLVMEGDGTLTGVSFSWISIDPAIDYWDAETMEGDAPVVKEPIINNNTPPVFSGLSVVVEQQTIAGGQTGAVAVISWGPSGRGGLRVEIQIKKTADSAWMLLVSRSTPGGMNTFTTGILDDGISYDVRANWFGGSGIGAGGDYSDVITFTATADPVAPNIVTSFVATGGVASADLSWTPPNSMNYRKTKIYQGTTSVFAASTFVEDVYTPLQTKNITGLAAGVYYFWAVAANGSNVGATEVASGPVTVV